MYLPGEQSDAIDLLLDSCQESAESLHEHLAASAQTIDIFPGNRCEQVVPADHLVYLRRGAVDVRLGDRVGMILQPGDWFLIPGETAWPLTYECEEKGSLAVVPPEALQAALQSGDFAVAYTRLLLLQNHALTLAYAHANRHGLRPAAGFRRFSAGQVVIEQDTASDQVYTLMRGRARVEIGGLTVGSIQEGEIFGVLSALVHAPHAADVIAETDITVMSVPSDQFIRLVQAQPETFMRLLRTLSRHISELNDRLLKELKRDRAVTAESRPTQG